MSYPRAPAPTPTWRLIPSRFPPIGLFDTVASAADLEAVMELSGWTNDRLVAERIARLPQAQWAHGRPNSSIVMAAFLHAAPGGLRFNGPDLGAWYAAAALATSVAEVAHHLRREAVARSLAQLSRAYRAYTAQLVGDHVDLRGLGAARPELYLSDDYSASQAFGEQLRADGETGLLCDSVRHARGVNVSAFWPANVQDVVQGDHYEIRVRSSDRRINARRISAPDRDTP